MLEKLARQAEEERQLEARLAEERKQKEVMRQNRIIRSESFWD
jgi:hypothetical protein